MNNMIKEADMNKKFFIISACLFFLGTGGLLLPAEGLSGNVDLNIGIGIGVPPLPAVVTPAPPAVYPIPGSYAYFAPDAGFQLFFNSGYWYRPYNGYWYRAAYHNGPWYYLPPSRVPVVFSRSPYNYYRYYRIPPGQRLIPYGHLRDHWREWNRGHYRWEDRRDDRHRHERNSYEGRREWQGKNRSWAKHGR
jgi:hypothetical protein